MSKARSTRSFQPSFEIMGRKGALSPAISGRIVLWFTVTSFAYELGFTRMPFWFFGIRSLVGAIGTFLLLWGWGKLTQKLIANQLPRAVANFTGVYAISMFRSIALGQLELAVTQTAYGLPLNRALLGGGVTIAMFVAFTFAAGLKRDFANETASLNATRLALKNMRSTLTDRVAKEEERIRESANAILLPVLEKLTGYGANSKSTEQVRAVIHDIRNALQSQVRPLAQSLNRMYSVEQYRFPTVPVETRKLRTLPKSFTPAEVLSIPMQLLATGPLMIALAVFRNSDPLFMFVMVAMNLVSVPAAIFLFRKLFSGLKLKTKGALVVLAVMHILLWLGPSMSMGFDDGAWLPNPALYGSLIVVILVTGYSLGNISLMYYNTQAMAQSRRKAEASLDREEAIFSQRIWVARRYWRYLIHGDVQSAFTLAASRIIDSARPSRQDLEQAIADLNRASESLRVGPKPRADLRTSLADLKAAWLGVCDVEASVSPAVDKAVAENLDLAFVINELAKECVGNAARHAQAKNIHIKLSICDDSKLQFEATNDGLALNDLDSKKAASIGSEMFDELTTAWSRVAGPNGVGAIVTLDIQL